MAAFYQAIIATPVGKLGINTQADQVANVDFLTDEHELIPPQNSLLQQVCNELYAYFENPRKVFKSPLFMKGTPFQHKVWQALTQIPTGSTLTYYELAKQLQTSARAIGNACRRNPISIIVPCHRIVAKQHLGGFCGTTSGEFLKIKQWLLRHEQTNI